MFEIGQLVVCIETQPQSICGEKIPEEKGIYTIRGVKVYPDCGDAVGVVLEEIVNPPKFYIDGIVEAHFGVEHFRPVTKRNEEIIAGLLVPKKDEVDA